MGTMRWICSCHWSQNPIINTLHQMSYKELVAKTTLGYPTRWIMHCYGFRNSCSTLSGIAKARNCLSVHAAYFVEYCVDCSVLYSFSYGTRRQVQECNKKTEDSGFQRAILNTTSGSSEFPELLFDTSSGWGNYHAHIQCGRLAM